MRYRVTGLWVSTMREGVIFVMADTQEKAGKEAIREGLVPRAIASAEPPKAPQVPVRARQPAHAGPAR